MPQRGRSRRAAARQTQLGQQRKKRQTRGPSGVPTTAHEPLVREAEDGAGVLAQERPADERTRPLVLPTPTTGRRAEPRPTVYSYVGPEVKRIVGLSAAVLILLIVLSFLLR